MEVFLIVIASLWLFSFVMRRWVAPWLLRRFIRRMQERMNSEAHRQARKEGSDIHISRKQKSGNHRTYSNAEYVDYEEVDDEK